MLQMIAESALSRVKLVTAGATVSAVKAVINPFASINSHLAVMFQSFAAWLLLTDRKNSRIRIFILSITAMMFTAFQRLFLLWLFYGVALFEAVNMFLTKAIGEFDFTGSNSSEYSLLLISLYLTAHLAAGVGCGVFLIRFTAEGLSAPDGEKILKEFNDSLPQIELQNNIIRKKFRWLVPITILMFITAVTYTLTPQNSVVLFSQILLRYIFALLLLLILRTLYVSIVKRRTGVNPGFIETVQEVKNMKTYFLFAYSKTKTIPLLKKPEVFFRILIQLAKLSAQP